MPAPWRRFYAAVLAAILTAPLGASAAEDVTLSLRGGGLTILGELMASDTGSFVIKSTKYGVMALETAKFDCKGAACPKLPAAFVSIQGSNTIGAQLMPATIERFAEREGLGLEKIIGNDPEEVEFKLTAPDGKDVATVALASHGSNTAPPGLQKNKAQIGAMSRPIKAEEVKTIAEAGMKVKTNIFALDGIVVLVSPTNPVKALSLDQLAKIFSGQITDWAEVGGSSGKINIYARDAKSGTYDTFDNLVLKPKSVKLSSQAKRYESSPDLSDDTSRDPNGIGFVGFAYLRSAKALSISSSCGIVSPAEVFAVKTEEYPLARRLFLYNVDANMPVTGEKLLSYAMSDGAQDVITENGFINQRIDSQTFDAQTNRLAPALLVPDKEFKFAFMRDLINDLKGANRLSMNFRFSRTAPQFDEKGIQDIPRLARFLKTDAYKNKKVYLVGFTDNGAAFDVNRAIAFSRATALKNALVADGVAADAITVRSYGNLLPVACNTTEAGKESNRRIEVWIRD